MLINRKPLGTVGFLMGLPTGFMEFTWSAIQFVQFNCEYVDPPDRSSYVHYDRARASDHSHARNQLVDQMRGDWLLQLDVDHQISPDLLVRLLHRMEEYSAEVVVGFYQERNPPHVPVLYKHVKDFYGAIGEWESNEPFYVDAAGAGCLLVKRGVFERIWNELHEKPFSKIPGLSEDLSFFQRVEKLGIKVLVDPRVQHPHLNVHPVTLADFNRESIQLYHLPESVPTD